MKIIVSKKHKSGFSEKLDTLSSREDVKDFLYKVEKYNFDELASCSEGGQLNWVGSEKSETLSQTLEKAMRDGVEDVDGLIHELSASLENDFNNFINTTLERLMNDILKHEEMMYTDNADEVYVFKKIN